MTLGLVYLSANVNSGANTAKLTAPLPTAMAHRVWLAVDAYTPTCEIVQAVALMPGNVVDFAPAAALAHGTGASVVILEDTVVTPQLFGALPNSGGIDCTPALMKAITATGRVFLPPGTYPITGIATGGIQAGLHLSGAYGSVYGADHRSVLVPFGPVQDMIRISDNTAPAGPPMMIQLENVTINGRSIANVGVHVYRGQNLVFNNVVVENCADGFFIDGAAAASKNRVMDVLLDNCYTSGCSGHGYRIETKGKVTGAFDVFTLLNCSSESDHVGCRVAGAGGGARSRIQSSEFQNSTSHGIEVNATTVSIANCYIEINALSHQSGISGLDVTSGGRVSLSDTVTGATTADATSTILVHDSDVNAVGPVRTPARLGQMADNQPWTASGWGPPNYPPPPHGAVYPKGFAYTDRLGVEWVCTTAGISGEAAFSARHGRILRPVTVTDLVNGNLLWFPHEDMVVTRVSLTITEDFVPVPGAQDLSLGTLLNGVDDDLIRVDTTTSPDLSHLTAGAVLVSTSNPKPYARLAPAGKEIFLAGSLPSVAPPLGHRISLFTHPVSGAWTAGAAVLLIEGYYLKYD